MSRVIAKYWGHENDNPKKALEIGNWIEYKGETLADCWKQIVQDGHSSDDWQFVEQEGDRVCQ